MISFFVAGLHAYAYGIQHQQFSVDRLYPENWYTKAREHCLLVWSALDEILQWKKNSVIPPYIVDAAIGQLVFAHHCIHTMITQNFAVVHDDVIHLSRIIGTIEERCAKLPPSIDADKVAVLHRVIAKLKKKIELLIAMVLKN